MGRPIAVVSLPFKIAMNNILIGLGLDKFYVRYSRQWERRRFSPTRTLQENVGFSHRDDVNQALHRVHAKLREICEKQVTTGGRILDIGSGTGLVTRQLTDRWKVVGIDLSPNLTEVARKVVPEADFYVGDILTLELTGGFSLAFSIGVLEYIPPAQLRAYFAKAAHLLTEDGILFVQYPHAISRLDLWHPNLLYSKYTPRVVQEAAAEFFETLEHHHSFHTDKIVEEIDDDPYPVDSFVNGYLYVGRKRTQK